MEVGRCSYFVPTTQVKINGENLTSKDYFFRHHLETKVEDNNKLKTITWIRCGLSGLNGIIKVRINHIGQIVEVGEY